MPPQVSVVLPFRNAEATLERAVMSILQQSLTTWELILVNHASTDGGGIAAQQWAQRDTRIRLVYEDRPGIVTALNRGLHEVHAPFIARMDADDVCHPDRLALQFNYLQGHPEVGAVGSQVRYRTTAGEPQPGMQAYVAWVNTLVEPKDIQQNRFVESPLVHPSVMFRTSLLAQYGTY